MDCERLISWRYSSLLVEFLLAILLLATAYFSPQLGASWFRAIETHLLRWSTRPTFCAAALFILVSGGRFLLLPIIPVPSPNIHDEFSYLLAGDTFSSGYLTNAPHRFWENFESVHILQQPTYMSMYPPLQGLFLALGWGFFGDPWLGVCISVALMVVAIYWMLLGWVSPAVALVGGALVAVRWGIFSYWMNSFWGGAPSAFGGALVLGSLPRLLREFRLREVTILAFGLCFLANSRPYEGLLVSAAAATVLAGWVWHQRRAFWLRTLQRSSRNLLLPLLLVLLCVTFMFFYNRSVTGSGWQLPYVLNRSQYATSPLLVFLPLRVEPLFRDEALRRVYAEEVVLYHRARGKGWLQEVVRKLKDFWLFFIGPLLTLPFVASFALAKARDHRAMFFALIISTLLAGLLFEVWFYPHYAAPAMAALTTFLVLGLNSLRSWCWRNRAVGLFLARSLPLGCVLLALLPINAGIWRFSLAEWPLQWYGGTREQLHAAAAFDRLGTGGQRDLVFVRYSATHRATDGEWIFNRADIDHAAVIWARDKGAARNIELVQYFRCHRVWLFEPDRQPWQLIPYDPARAGAN